MIPDFCNSIIRKGDRQSRCKLITGHQGRHNLYPFLDDLNANYPKIAKKIKQDAYHTRGNKTKPYKNRSFRWNPITIPLEEVENFKAQNRLGIPRKESATQEECFEVARKLARLVYEMRNAPACPPNIAEYLDQIPDAENNPCLCPLCRQPLDIDDFGRSLWGKAVIELWHIIPLSDNNLGHNAENTTWGHRICNIAQGERTTEQTLDWMVEILKENNRL